MGITHGQFARSEEHYGTVAPQVLSCEDRDVLGCRDLETFGRRDLLQYIL
jgi:hypothetical protein